MMDQAIYTRNLKPISIRRTTFLVHRKCTRKAKIYPKLQKSTKSKTEGMSRPLKAVLYSNKDRRRIRLNSMIECSSSSKIFVVPFLPYVPHNKLLNNTPNRRRPISPKTSKPTSKQLNHLFRHNPGNNKQAKYKGP